MLYIEILILFSYFDYKKNKFTSNGMYVISFGADTFDTFHKTSELMKPYMEMQK